MTKEKENNIINKIISLSINATIKSLGIFIPFLAVSRNVLFFHDEESSQANTARSFWQSAKSNERKIGLKTVRTTIAHITPRSRESFPATKPERNNRLCEEKRREQCKNNLNRR